MSFPVKMPGNQPHKGNAIICRATVDNVKLMADGGYRVWLDIPETDVEAATTLFKNGKKIIYYAVFQASKE